MKEAREIMVSVNTRAFTLDIPIEDDLLIEAVFKALKECVNQGFSFNVKESYVTSLSDSLQIITKIISRASQLDEWRAETRQLLSIIRKSK
ncbi:MAG: hypothetical protein JSV55_13950 [Deltaproteobacteria bacterium]|nr:MAG: hypothetical protein JSV40_00910 [Deltaproteobacteria bacterium]UCH07155.1 MAG: hypothetical protein JSV55_13950 [Deltaproteobacteria bacterium]